MTLPEGCRMPSRRVGFAKALLHKACRRCRTCRRVHARTGVYLYRFCLEALKNSHAREKVSGTSGTSGTLTLARVSGFLTSGITSGSIRHGG